MKRRLPKRWVQRRALHKSLDGKMRRSQPQAMVVEGTIQKKRQKGNTFRREKKRRDSMID